jgi:hypothetical protein
MVNKIKQFLREIFAPRVTYHVYSKEIKPEDWKIIGKDFNKVFENIEVELTPLGVIKG